MTPFRIAAKAEETQTQAQQDRFEARLEALAGTLERPAALRRSPFQRVVRSQPQLREA